MILVNKTDLVTPAEADRVERAVRVLNPGARVLRTVRSRVPLKEVMGTGLFDMEEASGSPGWLKSLTEEVGWLVGFFGIILTASLSVWLLLELVNWKGRTK